MTETSTDSILYEERGAIAVVTLNRPAALNSFTREMHQSLRRALDRAEAAPHIRALVLTGAGRGFCAGLDLSELDFTPGPGKLGDVLTCEGVEQTLSGRHGIYDMKVTNQNGEVVAVFRGKSAQIAGTVFPE